MKLNNAIKAGNLSLVESLLRNGADVNAEIRPLPLPIILFRLIFQPCLGLIMTTKPLMTAAVNGHVSTVSLLIKYGAQVNATNNRGLTALHFAYKHYDVASLLIENGAKATTACVKEQTPLHWACIRNASERTINLFITAMLFQNPLQKKPDILQQNPEYSAFWNEKQKQVNEINSSCFPSMKFSFNELVTKNINLLAISITTKELTRLQKIDFSNKYPDFWKFWKKRLSDISFIKNVINEDIQWFMDFKNSRLSDKVFSYAQDDRTIKIPELPARVILSYLSSEDLKSLRKAISTPTTPRQFSPCIFFKCLTAHDTSQQGIHLTNLSK